MEVEIEGEGTVEPEMGIFEKGTIVTFDIEPEDKWMFSHWEGRDKDDVQKKDGKWSVLINGSKMLTAVFTGLPYELKVNIVGQGDVEQEIYASVTESSEYPYGTIVELTAVPKTGWRFDEWQGDVSGTETSIRVRVDRDKEVTAFFVEQLASLNVDIVGRGKVEQAVVASSYPHGTTVKLTAVADDGYEFIRWSGDIESTNRVIETTIEDSQRITAIFTGPILSGYVTDSDGGSAVEGAKIYGTGFEILTDEEGYFEIDNPPLNTAFDLYVDKDDNFRTLVQDIYLTADDVCELDIPVRDPFNPKWAMSPSRISVQGVQRGDTVSGELDVRVSVQSELETKYIYIYFSRLKRCPFGNQNSQMVANGGTVTLDSSHIPNGDGYINIMFYDDNESLSLLTIPVTIDNNLQGDNQIPKDLEVLLIDAVTYSRSIGLYSEQKKEMYKSLNLEEDFYKVKLKDGHTIDLRTLPKNRTVFVDVRWEQAFDAEGYSVYRSLDGENFKLLANVMEVGYRDTDAILTPGSTIYYKVIPYNNSGMSNGLVKSVKLLEPLNIYLKEPANRAFDVPLRPTFTWELDTQFDEEVEMVYDFYMLVGAKPQFLEVKHLSIEEYTVDFDLEPGAVFSWDITEGYAYALYQEGDNGYSNAYSFSGGLNWGGSCNGEFIFTTITENE